MRGQYHIHRVVAVMARPFNDITCNYAAGHVNECVQKSNASMYKNCQHQRASAYPYPEPVYTGWSSVHWNATGMPLVDPVYTGIPLEKLS